MRSLYVGILLALLGMLALSLVVFLVISDRVERQYLNPVFEAMDELELQSARNALESGGRAAAASYLEELNRLFGTSHFLLNSDGVDVVSGEQRGKLLPPPPLSRSRSWINGQYVVTHRSEDGKYWFLAVDPRTPSRWTLSPFYALVIAVAGVLTRLCGSAGSTMNVTTQVEIASVAIRSAALSIQPPLDAVRSMLRSFRL